MGIYINGIDMPKQDELLQIRVYGDGKVSRVYDIECQQIGIAVETTSERKSRKETAMTRYEAIKVLTYLREIIKEIPKALCKLPHVKERKGESIIALHMAIKALQAETVQGKWQCKSLSTGEMFYGCSECGNLEINTSNFCPNCGADMRGNEHEFSK